MAHFAKLDERGNVTDVLVIKNSELLDSSGQEREELGVAFLILLLGWPYWKQTSYNGTIRKNFAGIGSIYDSERDAFIAPQPYDSWRLDDETCRWVAPVPCPDDGKEYIWDEETTRWI